VLASQGVGEGDANRFLDQAAERGLGDFLENPQNLIMLWRAVQTGSWPATRKELFELATQLMLQELNGEHARSGAGIFLAAELRLVAGAICASRLISDVDAIRLTDQQGTPDSPSYRSLDLFSPEKVQAVLGRRIFDAASEPEAVDYAHRTTAEFLAAEFLASRVRVGLPFGRVLALIGVDGQPASELRGLHAWIAVHLPEHADELIEADPYGVLTYGDAASLSTSSCAVLVRALAKLSQTNPWFRSGNWQARPIGALARHDMVNEFRNILNKPASGFGVRSIVAEALALGQPLPEMLPDLQAILARDASTFSERVNALDALLRLGADGNAAIQSAFATQLGDSVNDLRIRAMVIKTFYRDPYGPKEVIALVKPSSQVDASNMVGVLHSLGDFLPLEDLPTILDGIEAPKGTAANGGNGRREVASLYARLLAREWSNPSPAVPARVFEWLQKCRVLKGGVGESHGEAFRAVMQAKPERLRGIAAEFFTSILGDKESWLALHRFQETILFALSADELGPIAMRAFEGSATGTSRRRFLYEVSLSLSYQMTPLQSAVVFDDLYERAENDLELRAVRDGAVVANLPSNYLEHRTERGESADENRAQQQKEFDEHATEIRQGNHLGWLQHLARIYFAHYNDIDGTLPPRDRIAAWLGKERGSVALEGLVASLSRNDLPSFDDVMKLTADHQHYGWWYALVAGLNERWAVGEGLPQLSEDFFKGMLAFDIVNPVFTREGGAEHWVIHRWRTALTEWQSELARDAYLAVARLRLSRKEQTVDGLRELLDEPAFERYRPVIVIELLREFPNADPLVLGDLLGAVAGLSGTHQDFLQLAGPVIASTVFVDERQRDLWLATAYIIAPAQYESEVKKRAATRPAIVFDLRDRMGFARRHQPDQPLPLPMVEFMARLTGSLFVETPFPARGWSGDTNACDASEYFRGLTNMISASPSSAATDALQRLEANPQLASYKAHLLYALANQKQRRREADYDRPDWAKTIAALANRAPATVADLHALLVAHWRDLAHRVARENTDLFKQFWNIDGNAKPTAPRPEEACRDDVINMLRPVLLPLSITIEPESHLVADKRADISVAMPNRKVLCELKRDYHDKVWTALMEQLERFYAHDPEAKGFGVYVVFWFGDKRPTQIPAPPNGTERPKTAVEMEAMLQSLLSDEMRKRLTVIVLDVSGEI
jgi:predicted NACHT family NTPase